jgi:hypothetical protein
MKRGKQKYVLRTYVAGRVVEKIKFKLDEPNGKTVVRRSAKERAKRITTEHDRGQLSKVARLMNNNFHSGDFMVGLDYSGAELAKLQKQANKYLSDEIDEEHALALAARKDLRNYLDRCRRAFIKTDKAFLYLAVTSDMDGDTGEIVRVHHHLVINRAALKICKAKWRGGFDYQPIEAWNSGLRDIAAYFLKQVRHFTNEKAYIPSRTLIIPRPEDSIVYTAAAPRPPKDAFVEHVAAYRPGHVQYLRYIIPKGGGGNKLTR